MQREARNLTGAGHQRRGIRRAVLRSQTAVAMLASLVLAGAAIALATSLPTTPEQAGPGAVATGISGGTAASDPAAVAAESPTTAPPSPSLAPVSTQPVSPVATVADRASSTEPSRDGDEVAGREGTVSSEPRQEATIARAEPDDLQPRRPSLASRGGDRPVEPAEQPSAQSRRQVVTYRVVEGDTVLGLAERYGVIPEELIAVNGLAPPYLLQAGQQLLIPEVSPEKLAAPVAPQPGGSALKPTTYVVASGDTLSGLAARFGLTVETLRWANPDLANADALAIGQQLLVPPVDGALHRVRSGDTINGVAALYGASAAELVRANALVEPYTLSLGQVLVVPGGQPPAAALAQVSQPPARPAPGPAVASAAATPGPAKPTATPRLAALPASPKPAVAPAPAAAAPAPSRSDVGARIVAEAMKYRGYRYTWGGTSPRTGFDCSGFVWYIYRQAGVPITRDLWGQYNTGARISRNALQPGDIAFFQNTYKPGLSHDGIYVGGGQFIHAASENTGVIVSSLAEPYWAARYLGANRPR